MKRKYTDEHMAFIQCHYKGVDSKTLTNMINQHFGTSFTVCAIDGFRYKHGLISGITNHGRRLSPSTEFKKGNVPYNKGKKGLTHANCTSFKVGHKPKNTHPLGTMILREDGYVYVKVKEITPSRFGWKALHIINWEKENGPVPSGHKLLFLDGNHENCDVSNLMLITSGQMATINKFRLTSKNPDLTRAGATLASLISKTYQMQNGKQNRNGETL